MSATVAIQGKGKKVGTPNYKNEVLLNLIEFYLPAGNEQWKIVAQRYQEVSKEAFLRKRSMTSLISAAKKQISLSQSEQMLAHYSQMYRAYNHCSPCFVQ